MKTYLALSVMLAVAVTGILLPGGCACTDTETSARAPAPAPEPAAAPARAGESPSGPWLASRTYPAGDVVRLDLRMPNEVPVNAGLD